MPGGVIARHVAVSGRRNGAVDIAVTAVAGMCREAFFRTGRRGDRARVLMSMRSAQLRNQLVLLVIASRAGDSHYSAMLRGRLSCDSSHAEAVGFFAEPYRTALSAAIPVGQRIVLRTYGSTDTVIACGTEVSLPLTAFRADAVITAHALGIYCAAVLAATAVGAVKTGYARRALLTVRT